MQRTLKSIEVRDVTIDYVGNKEEKRNRGRREGGVGL